MNPKTATILVAAAIMMAAISFNAFSDRPTPPQAADVKVLALTANDPPNMVYSPRMITVKAGQKIKLTLKNIGKIPKAAMGHNWILLVKGVTAADFGLAAIQPDSGANPQNGWIPTKADLKAQMIKYTKLLGPGESDTIEFTAPTEAGNYVFMCSFPGHFGLMNGVLTVK